MGFVLTEELVPGCLTLFGDSRGPAVMIDTEDHVLRGQTRLYLNKVEVGEIARPFGFIAPEHIEQLEQQLADAQADLSAADEKVATAEEALAAFRLTSDARETELRDEVRRLEAQMDEMEIRSTKRGKAV